MSAQDPQGGQKFWFNGLPFPGVKVSARGTGGVKYWFNGLPEQTLFVEVSFVFVIHPFV
jgi:hypothetical protein